MKMKKLLIILMALFFNIKFVNATGIPTIDVGTISQLFQNALEAAQQSKDQIEKLQSQIDYYKSIYEGNWDPATRGMSDIDMTEGLPKEWEDVYKKSEDNIEDLRKKYNLSIEGNEEVQKKIDNTLYKLDFYEKNYQRNLERVANFKKISSLLSSADTPTKREVLANRLAYEQLQLQADRSALDNMNALMEQQEKIREQQADTKNMQFFFSEKQNNN